MVRVEDLEMFVQSNPLRVSARWPNFPLRFEKICEVVAEAMVPLVKHYCFYALTKVDEVWFGYEIFRQRIFVAVFAAFATAAVVREPWLPVMLTLSWSPLYEFWHLYEPSAIEAAPLRL